MVVQLRYSGALVSRQESAVTDGRGRFSAQLQANGTLPGRYNVTADDGSQTTSARGPVTIPWQTGSVANGSHTLRATVRDATGHTGSTSRTVTVSN